MVIHELTSRIAELSEENKQLKEKYDTLTNKFFNSETDKTHLRAENETLTRENENRNDWIKSLNKKCEDLIAENERLKAENEEMKKSFVSHSEFMNILENNPNINWEETAKENIYLINKYKQALEEIREIADLIVNDEDKPSCVNDDDCPFNDGYGLDNHCNMNCPYILGKHIQTKISEVNQ